MTVIVAVQDPDRVWMACDSQGTQGSGTKTHLKFAKILRIRDGLLIGFCSLTIREFCQYGLEPGHEGLPLEHTAWILGESLRGYLQSRNLMEKAQEGVQEFPSNFLLARGKEFVEIDSRGNVIRHATPYWAIGSGGPEARGALRALTGLVSDPRQRAIAAVEAAMAFDTGCSGDVHVFHAAEER